MAVCAAAVLALEVTSEAVEGCEGVTDSARKNVRRMQQMHSEALTACTILPNILLVCLHALDLTQLIVDAY